MPSQIFTVGMNETGCVHVNGDLPAAIGSDNLAMGVQAAEREEKSRNHCETAGMGEYTDIKLTVTGIRLGGELKSSALKSLNMGGNKSRFFKRYFL